jgi:hypothetical protein
MTLHRSKGLQFHGLAHVLRLIVMSTTQDVNDENYSNDEKGVNWLKRLFTIQLSLAAKSISHVSLFHRLHRYISF